MGQDASAQETEDLTLTDVSFHQKQLLYFLDNCESMIHILIEELMCNLGDPGKPARFFLLQPCQMCHTLWKRNIVLLPTLLEEVRCIPVNILSGLYVVKFWEGMVQKSLSCHTILEAWHALWFFCSFSCCTVPSILYA